MASTLPPLLTGTLFGSALLASSVYRPDLILAQFRLSSFHVLSTFLTASACSALIVYASNRLGYVALPPRSNSSYGWFGAYDANLVGGVLQGVGMAVTGACPGTMLVQAALGDRIAMWVGVGGLLGGLGFVVLGERIKGRGGKMVGGGHTVMQRAGVAEETAVVGYEIMLLTAIASVDKLASGDSVWASAVVGGLMIGAAQASSVVFAKKTLGVSSAFAELAGHVTSLLKGNGLKSGFGNVLFALGVVLGARAASQYVPVAMDHRPAISIGAALIGGFCSIFGARLAGGCTSGHGISGMSTLSVSSFVTIAGLVGGGLVCRKALDTL